MPSFFSVAMSIAVLIAGWLTQTGVAHAHPHVYVTAKAEVVFDKGAVAAVQNHWTFDEYYTAMAVEGLDTNKDGIYSREELADLAKVNMDGLKEFDYFTFAKLGENTLKFGAPQDAWLEHKNGELTLHFRLPLATPLDRAASGVNFALYDPSYFIAFDLAKGDAIGLSGAPEGCKVTVGAAEPTPDEKTLTGAFSQSLGGGSMGTGAVKSATVTCAKP
jgi:ABC-type uncharacterized transport system substrate-binding protein